MTFAEPVEDEPKLKARVEYRQGRTAFRRGENRNSCPYESGFGSENGYSVKRHAWMAGHLDEEFSTKSYNLRDAL